MNVLLSTGPSSRNWRDVWINPPSHFCFMNGPEGGFTAQEESSAFEHGFEPVSLGHMILRSETAPIAVLAQLL